MKRTRRKFSASFKSKNGNNFMVWALNYYVDNLLQAYPILSLSHIPLAIA